jgi:hypothetical protein
VVALEDLPAYLERKCAPLLSGLGDAQKLSFGNLAPLEAGEQ